MIIARITSRLPSRALPRTAIILVTFGLFAACANNDEEETVINDVTEAYGTAEQSVSRGNYRRGIQIYEAIQARYPFSDLSRQLQLDLMFAYYKAGMKEQAVEAADTFIRENPIHERVDYALYIKGLAYFEDEAGFLEKRFNRDVTQRPPMEIPEAYSSFRRLVERYPASQYAPDAEQRMVYLKNRLSEYENHVADYYLRRGAYIAALNRAKNALEEYNGASGNADSLKIMEQAYDKLGMHDLAGDARRVRELNYPNES
ncbi:MAG: outer membrane protein assembly factor BamD [Woeseiaceae bacterium]|nr:outer membrane protein assembly factor BamD [Woeseiaceae bacterium]